MENERLGLFCCGGVCGGVGDVLLILRRLEPGPPRTLTEVRHCMLPTFQLEYRGDSKVKLRLNCASLYKLSRLVTYFDS